MKISIMGNMNQDFRDVAKEVLYQFDCGDEVFVVLVRTLKGEAFNSSINAAINGEIGHKYFKDEN